MLATALDLIDAACAVVPPGRVQYVWDEGQRDVAEVLERIGQLIEESFP